MSKKLTAHMMSKLAEGIERINATGVDFEGSYLSIISEKEAIVKADSDFDLGMGLGIALGNNASLTDGLEFKFLANVEYGKLYQISLDYGPEIGPMVEFELFEKKNDENETPALSES